MFSSKEGKTGMVYAVTPYRLISYFLKKSACKLHIPPGKPLKNNKNQKPIDSR
jgi:hypothetical protein